MGKKKKSREPKKDFQDKLKEIAKKEFGMEITDDKSKESRTQQDSFADFYMNHNLVFTNENRKAKAPYNFVPLNQKFITSDFKVGEVTFDKYHSQRFTGYIKVEIKTETPIYIRDNLNENQLKELSNIETAIENAKQKKENEKVKELEKQKLWSFPDFFSPANGKLRIPGSSLRGLIRNMVEIISFGRFHYFDDKRLYMRGFADPTLGPVYKNYGLSSFSRGKVSYNMKCGLLKLDGFNYKIIESGTPTQIPISIAKSKIAALSKTRELFKHYYDPSAKEYIVVSGYMNNKRNDWIVKEPPKEAREITLSKIDIEDYLKDENRTKEKNIIEELKISRSKIPCFYVEWTDDKGNNRISFGHTGMFRVPYKKTIGEHIPKELQVENITDIAEAIFGNENKFAGRVFFEDSFCDAKKDDILEGEHHPKILSGPKPTTFQHYLTQISENVRELKHYNPDDDGKLSAIRGYKLYWHKSGINWQANSQDVNAHPTQYTNINPVKKGTTFTGRIRFENLSDVELGALLFALDLPNECCHKIGMGKPLGLGSIRITPTLNLSNRKERYEKLFSDEWETEKKPLLEDGKKIQDFKDKFANYILCNINNITIDPNKTEYKEKNLWELDRMKELKKMLDFERRPDDEKTRYMEIQRKVFDKNGNPVMERGKQKSVNEFRNRPVLPKPRDVI